MVGKIKYIHTSSNGARSNAEFATLTFRRALVMVVGKLATNVEKWNAAPFSEFLEKSISSNLSNFMRCVHKLFTITPSPALVILLLAIRKVASPGPCSQAKAAPIAAAPLSPIGLSFKERCLIYYSN